VAVGLRRDEGRRDDPDGAATVTGLDRLRAMIDGMLEPPPVAKLVGMRLVSAERGHTVFELDAGPQHANPMGTLHGGILCDVADAALGTAWVSTLADDETFTTLELKINFLRPFWTGQLVAHGAVISRGKTVGLAECRVVDDQERLIAHATSTNMALRGDAAKGR
jgi:uncharacterized protein (TIGR00369 family)